MTSGGDKTLARRSSISTNNDDDHDEQQARKQPLVADPAHASINSSRHRHLLPQILDLQEIPNGRRSQPDFEQIVPSVSALTLTIDF